MLQVSFDVLVIDVASIRFVGFAMPRLFGAFLEERLDTCEQLCFIWFDGKTFKISKTLVWHFDLALWHAV